MLEYRDLDAERNEIRLITILGLTGHDSELDPGCDTSLLQQDFVECLLDHVSLDEYTPGYSRFLEIDGPSQSGVSQVLLWELVTANKDEGERMLQRKLGFVYETLRTFVDKPKYHDRSYTMKTQLGGLGETLMLSPMSG
jgi:hypothetical protein